MKVSVDISPEYKEPYAVIYTDRFTDDIQRMIDLFGANETPVTALKNEEDHVVLHPEETIIYERDDLPMPVRVIIHMGTGCIVYTITAFAVGWIG